MIQIVAMIVLASGVSFTAKLPKPTFADVAQCQAYLKTEDFKADFAVLSKQVMHVHKQEFTSEIHCKPAKENSI